MPTCKQWGTSVGKGRCDTKPRPGWEGEQSAPVTLRSEGLLGELKRDLNPHV